MHLSQEMYYRGYDSWQFQDELPYRVESVRLLRNSHKGLSYHEC